MGLIPPSYAEMFEKHKLFEGNFPLAESGVRWFTWTYRLIKVYIFLWFAFFPWSRWSPTGIREGAYWLKGWGDRIYYWILNTEWVAGVIKSIATYTRLVWLNRFSILGWTIVLSILVYLTYLVRRQRLYERQVLANDYASYVAKKAVLAEFKIKDRLEDVDALIEEERNSESKSNQKSKINQMEQEKEAIKSMRKTMIVYNTRENLSHKVRRTITIYFYSPGSRLEKDSFDKLKEPFVESAQIVLQQFFSDERDRGEAVRGDSFVQTVIEEAPDPYYYGEELEELEKMKTASEYYHSSPHNAFTYNGETYLGLSDKSLINEQRHKEAKRWSSALTDEILGILRQNGYNTNFSHLTIESRTAEIFYKLPKNFKKPSTNNLKSIEEVIQEQINSSSKPTVTVGIDTIRVSVALPNGKDKNGNDTDNFVQLLDTERILRRNFG